MSRAARPLKPGFVLETAIAIAIKREKDGPPLSLEPVTPADLSAMVGEAWRDCCLRQGYPETALADLPMRLSLRRNGQDGGPLPGFRIECLLPEGRRRRRRFSLKGLAPVARRAADRLRASGVLVQGQSYIYELVPSSGVQAVQAPDPVLGACSVRVTTPPLQFLKMALRPLLEQATPVALLDDAVFPVFFLRQALEQAEQCARQGMQAMRPVETGGVLVGSLAACPESGEFFAVITDVLEAQEAEQTAFSLAYSSESWRRIQNIIRARQAAWPERAERMLGQCHGHNFQPHDEQACAACERRPVCDLTSVFVSPDDEAWMQAVFARQPWALCHIFGLSARREKVSTLYSLSDGRWQPRGYYVLPDFQPENREIQPSP